LNILAAGLISAQTSLKPEQLLLSQRPQGDFMKKFVFLFLIMTLFRTSAFATQQVSSEIATASDFRKSVEISQAACTDMRCPQSVLQATLVSRSEWLALPDEVRNTIHSRVRQRADFWNDTILESDYEAKGRAALDAVEVLVKDQKVVGYRFQFSKQAWDTSTCAFDSEKPDLSPCQQGRIVDAAFISADLREIFQDEQSYAHFVADPAAGSSH
jgi:hypothetical protein